MAPWGKGRVYVSLALLGSILLGCAGLLGCTGEGVGIIGNGPDPGANTDEEFIWVDEHVASILFVIDSAPGTCGLHQSFLQGIPAFFQGLDLVSSNTELRFNIGVVGTGDAAAPLAGWPVPDFGACEIPDADCADLPQPLPSVITEETIAVHRTLACLAEVGDAGGGVDPYAVAAAALSPESLAESGLVLEGSLLAVIIVSDGDPGGCDSSDGFQCHIGGLSTTGAYALEARIEMLQKVTDVYVARLSAGEIDSGSTGTTDPIGGGTSPVCTLPGVGGEESPDCMGGLGDDLFDVGKIIASAVVPQCLDVQPCPGVGTEDVEVSLEGPGAMLAPFEDFLLVPDPFCPGGFRIDFAEDPFPGELVSVAYPAGSPATCGF